MSSAVRETLKPTISRILVRSAISSLTCNTRRAQGYWQWHTHTHTLELGTWLIILSKPQETCKHWWRHRYSLLLPSVACLWSIFVSFPFSDLLCSCGLVSVFDVNTSIRKGH
jgi:hypothetical protein